MQAACRPHNLRVFFCLKAVQCLLILCGSFYFSTVVFHKQMYLPTKLSKTFPAKICVSFPPSSLLSLSHSLSSFYNTNLCTPLSLSRERSWRRWRRRVSVCSRTRQRWPTRSLLWVTYPGSSVGWRQPMTSYLAHVHWSSMSSLTVMWVLFFWDQ